MIDYIINVVIGITTIVGVILILAALVWVYEKCQDVIKISIEMISTLAVVIVLVSGMVYVLHDFGSWVLLTIKVWV